MSGSSFVVPSAVFSGLSALSGPVAVVGSRSLPSAVLLSVARLRTFSALLRRSFLG